MHTTCVSTAYCISIQCHTCISSTIHHMHPPHTMAFGLGVVIWMYSMYPPNAYLSGIVLQRIHIPFQCESTLLNTAHLPQCTLCGSVSTSPNAPCVAVFPPPPMHPVWQCFHLPQCMLCGSVSTSPNAHCVAVFPPLPMHTLWQCSYPSQCALCI